MEKSAQVGAEPERGVALDLTWGELARATGGDLLRGEASDPAGPLCLDTRRMADGGLLWALKGARFDAHDFLDEGLARRADGWVVRAGHRPAAQPRRLVEVPDTLKALSDLAAWHRRRFDIPVAGVTGSNGKTTTREMLRAILAAAAGPEAVCSNSGNLNNEVGLPLTVLRLEKRHRFAVFELGASRKGDIAYLARAARPTAAVLTNIGSAHLEFFGSLEGTFQAKTELVEALPPGGPVAFNLDDPFLARLLPRLQGRAFPFGRDPRAAVRVLDAEPGVLALGLPSARIELRREWAGHLFRLNAAAAAAGALALGLDADDVRRGLEAFAPAPLRFQLRSHPSGARLVLDAYNANPDSMRAGIRTFLETAGARAEAMVVLGDMKELGPESRRLHRELGEWLASQPLAAAFLAGELMAEAAAGLKARGAAFPVLHAAAPEGLLAELRGRLRPGAALYFKASRSVKLEDLAERL